MPSLPAAPIRRIVESLPGRTATGPGPYQAMSAGTTFAGAASGVSLGGSYGAVDMAEPAHRRWTIEEFFDWQETQPHLYELVGGQPQLMAGVKNVHDDIVVNIVSELKNQTRGTGCRPFTGDGAVETGPDQIRRPDVGLDCGNRRPNSTLAAGPRLVVEVLSPSTRDFNAFDKLDDYKSVAGMEYILLVEPNQALAKLWSRTSAGAWPHRTINGLDAEIDLPNVGVSLRMRDVYDGVEFPRMPKLVADEDEPSTPSIR